MQSQRASGRHPTQKPLEIVKRIVRLWTNRDDLVLDCFLGTGTTAVVAEMLGRRWIGIERDPAYAAVARSRIAEARAQSTLGG
ncbi:MAG: DNA-methyltransferase [Candidatus Binataceae bacterium]